MTRYVSDISIWRIVDSLSSSLPSGVGQDIDHSCHVSMKVKVLCKSMLSHKHKKGDMENMENMRALRKSEVEFKQQSETFESTSA